MLYYLLFRVLTIGHVVVIGEGVKGWMIGGGEVGGSGGRERSFHL